MRRSLMVGTLLLVMAAPSALATPGRTNAQGCHNSKKAGYHCHGAAKGKKHAISKADQAVPRGSA